MDTLPVIKPRTIKRSGRCQRGLKTKNLGPYALMQTLGEGEYGKVKFAIHRESKQEVAVKLIRKESAESDARRSRIEREIHALKTLHHPNIIKLYDIIETEKYFAMVLEYAAGGELFEYIQAHQALPEEDAQSLFGQLISSVNYMHQKQIVHRDLKLENLLLDRNKNLMVTDFGFANWIAKDGLMATSCGSPCYAAPELVLNGSRGRYAGPAADVWSCGVILYGMLCGHLPYGDDPDNPEGRNVGQLYRYILRSAGPQFPSHVSPDASDLVRQMLTPDPLDRCTLESVTRHRWLRSQTPLLSKAADELEQDATAAPRSATTDDGRIPKPSVSTGPHSRQGSIKSLFLPRKAAAGRPDLGHAFHSLRSKFKASLPNDEAVAFEQDMPPRLVRVRRHSTLGRATRQPNDQVDSARTTPKRVKTWLRRIGQSEAKNEDKATTPMIYRGLVDQAALTSWSPTESMAKVRQILLGLGIDCEPVSPAFRMECTRPAKNPSTAPGLESSLASATEKGIEPIYGDPGTDPAEQVKFVVEICRLANVPNLYIVHVRRLGGSEWAFNFVYRKLTGFLEILGVSASCLTS